MGVETGAKYSQDQWEAIQRLRDHLKEPESPGNDSMYAEDQGPNLTNALMRLCMLVVMQDTSSIKLYESPLMHYLAVRGVDEKSKALRSPFFYTPILAGACGSAGWSCWRWPSHWSHGPSWNW
jgi:hypothetical protein